ncbi:MAG: alpha/beta fold hydrolase [Mesorhizobium sp.]|nr:alpha/beta fold hydrolase [Mesorhizobium sp.]MBN9241820.1 alpha/beta fold hydrolase [Mesorhizobium sp.]
MRPLVFDGTIGWLHEAGGRRGVVIAGAHGFEDLCSRRFLMLLAGRMAAEGLPVLQFDYPGCGDAAGDHAAPRQVEAWVKSIGAAIDRLKRETGVTDVVVVGFRLGALLAPLVAAGRDDVAGLALLAPPASGRTYVREMTALSRMIDAPLAARGPAEPFDGRQVAGFRLSSETLAALAELDWQQALAEAAAPHVLVLANGTPPEIDFPRRKNGAGLPAVTVAEFEGYAHLARDPTANRIPEAALDLVTGWIGHLAVEGGDRAVASASRGPQMLAGPGYREEPVVIGGGSEICGVLCRPAKRGASTTPVIFLNAGAVPHVGWARGTVEAARALAVEGVASLRIDLPGIGQSAAPAEERLFLYDGRTRRDVIRVIDWMEEAGFAQVGVVGACSGAFQALHAARADRRVRRLMMINPLCFAWNSSYALELAVWKTYGTSKVTMLEPGKGDGLQGAVRSSAFGALRTGLSKLARRPVRRLLELIKTALAVPARLSGRTPVERWMRGLGSRGVRVLMVTSEGDLSLEEIARHFGPDGERLGAIRGVSRLSIAAADHTLTPCHARRALVAPLIEFGLEDDFAGKAGMRAAPPTAARPALGTP